MEVSQVLCVSPSTVERWLKDFGLAKPKIQHTYHNQNCGAWLLDDERKMIGMYFKGDSLVDIASALNRSITAVYVKLCRVKRRDKIKFRRVRNAYQKKFVVKV